MIWYYQIYLIIIFFLCQVSCFDKEIFYEFCLFKYIRLTNFAFNWDLKISTFSLPENLFTQENLQFHPPQIRQFELKTFRNGNGTVCQSVDNVNGTNSTSLNGNGALGSHMEKMSYKKDGCMVLHRVKEVLSICIS